MNDAARVRVRHGLRHRDQNGQVHCEKVVECERMDIAIEEIGPHTAVDELHCQNGTPRGIRAEVVDGNDVGMLEPRGRQRFLLETRHDEMRVLPLVELLFDDLERDDAIERRLDCLPDLTESSFSGKINEVT